MATLNTHRDFPSEGEIDYSLLTRKPLIIGEAPVPFTGLTAFPLWGFADEARTQRKIQPTTRELLRSVFAGSDELRSLERQVDSVRAEKLYERFLDAFELTNLLLEIQRTKDRNGKYKRPPGGDPFDNEKAAKNFKQMQQDVENYDPDRVGVVPTLYGRFAFMFGRSGDQTWDRLFGDEVSSITRNQFGHVLLILGKQTKNGILVRSFITALYHPHYLMYASEIEQKYAKALNSAMLQAAYNSTFPDYQPYMITEAAEA